jgi:hypothetical protein
VYILGIALFLYAMVDFYLIILKRDNFIAKYRYNINIPIILNNKYIEFLNKSNN